MPPSRRSIICTGTAVGAGLLAGCIGEPIPGGPDDDTDDTGLDDGTDDNEDNGTDDDSDDCAPIDLPVVDEPPHEPERPPQPDDVDAEDDWDVDYLGAGMEANQSRSFEQLSLRFTEEFANPDAYSGDTVVYATLLTSQEEFEDRVKPVDDESTDRVSAIDFDAEVVIAVLSGFGSSSVRHEWVRVEESCGALHLHGYYRQPWIQTDDIAPRMSGVVVERSAAIERAGVSLTVDEKTRVNVATDQDVQAVNGTETHYGPIEHVETVDVGRDAVGDWHIEDETVPGVVVQLQDANEVRALVNETDAVDMFLGETDFAEDAVCYLESVAPDACHRTIDLDEVAVIANGDYEVNGNATVVDVSDTDEDCAAIVTYPAVLVRIESEVDLARGTFRIEDGWGNADRVAAIGFDEFAQE